MIYLDNNGTTLIAGGVKEILIKYCSCVNPSGTSEKAKRLKSQIDKVKERISKDLGCPMIIFTSGGTEANATVLHALNRSTIKNLPTGQRHLIISSVEHTSSLESAKNLSNLRVSIVKVDKVGRVTPDALSKIIKENGPPDMVFIMSANNETGTIMPTAELVKIARKSNINVYYHTDAVQFVGKMSLDIKKLGVDSASISAHKFHGPKGIGILAVNNRMCKLISSAPMFCGSQQEGLRAGTENVSAILATGNAWNLVYTNRQKKNKSMMLKKLTIISRLTKELDAINIDVIIIGDTPSSPRVLPHVILLAFVPRDKTIRICNVKLRDALSKESIIVGIGSTCNASKKNASHVLYAMKIPPRVRSGVIRLSLSDNTKKNEVIIAVKKIIKVLPSSIIPAKHKIITMNKIVKLRNAQKTRAKVRTREKLK